MKKTRPEARNPSYDIVLNAARTRGRFNRAELVEETGLSSSVVGQQVRRMIDRREIRVIDKVAGVERMEFHEVKPLAVDADSPQQALWEAMRISRRFTPIDLVAALRGTTPVVDVKEARAYCQALHRAKYLVCKIAAVPGRREATYHMAVDSGPKAPFMKRLTVLVDPNDERVAWTPEVVS